MLRAPTTEGTLAYLSNCLGERPKRALTPSLRSFAAYAVGASLRAAQKIRVWFVFAISLKDPRGVGGLSLGPEVWKCAVRKMVSRKGRSSARPFYGVQSRSLGREKGRTSSCAQENWGDAHRRARAS